MRLIKTGSDTFDLQVRIEIEAARILAGDPAEESNPSLIAGAWDLVRDILCNDSDIIA